MASLRQGDSRRLGTMVPMGAIHPIGLHDHGRERRLDLPGLEQHRLEPGLGEARVEPLRQGPGLQADAGQRQAELAEEADQCLGLARHLRLTDDPSGRVDHADAAPFQRDIDPGVRLHGCPSMMPGADLLGPRTHHHSEGQPPRRSWPAQARYMA
jgi:hypothetical protein